MKDVLRCATMENGVQSVIMTGIIKRQELSVVS